jgi:hypothetical protein
MKLNLPEEITVNLPGPNGSSISRKFTSLPITLIDSDAAKRIQVLFPPLKVPMTLWSGEEYVSLGAYTQSQVSSRIFSLLGEDWKAGLSNLATPQQQGQTGN